MKDLEQWLSGHQRPASFDDVYEFYYGFVRRLYSAVCAHNYIPSEVLIEIHAAFDHIGRHYKRGESEQYAAGKVYSHLKRSCLDMFKLILRDTYDNYSRLLTYDLSMIDNGEFEKELHKLYGEIYTGAIEARTAEGDKTDHEVSEFYLWIPVYERCVRLNTEFFLSSKVQWAQKHQKINDLIEDNRSLGDKVDQITEQNKELHIALKESQRKQRRAATIGICCLVVGLLSLSLALILKFLY